MLTKEQIEEIKRRWAAAEKPPWRWEGTDANYHLRLESKTGISSFVMTFKRWGTHAAQPAFRDVEADVMSGASELLETDGVRIVGINHPTAKAIEKSAEDVRDLLQHIEELEAKLAAFDAMAIAGTIDGIMCSDGWYLTLKANGSEKVVPLKLRSEAVLFVERSERQCLTDVS